MSLDQPPQTVPFQPKTVAQVMGEIVWLMTQSPLHKQMFIADLEWFLMPAILLEQFRLFYGPAPKAAPAGATPMPAACALWARVSPETAARLEAGAHKLAAHEWAHEGGELWLIELVAPFGAQEEILRDLATNLFKGDAFKFHMTGPDGARRVVKSQELLAKPN
jgi:cytolysin-activating lysine-acyltransferase